MEGRVPSRHATTRTTTNTAITVSSSLLHDNFSSLSLEALAYKFGTDKSKDDHGYTNLYQMLFDPIRWTVTNVTEMGVSAGQSLQVWFHYFPNAHIHGFDPYHDMDRAETLFSGHRVHIYRQDVLDPDVTLQDVGLVSESMDIVIEDGFHTVDQQEAFLQKLFTIVKPGGYYIIEDVGYRHGGLRKFHTHPEELQEATRAILESHDCVFVDAHLGHRAWNDWKRRAKKRWAADHVQHNSYLVVIRKRTVPPRPVQINLGRVAMRLDRVINTTS
jgi:SAM-dependent methyltransferase